MLAEAAKKEIESRKVYSVLEIGCGSGIVSLTCANRNSNASVLGVDINPDAVACSTENAKLNNIKNVRFIESDLFSNIQKNKKFDIILFNPPYLPTSDGEHLKGNLDHAFDGGVDGRKVLDRFLGQFDSFLAPHGVLLIVQSSLNNPEKTKTKLKSLGYATTVVAEEKFFFEKLFVIKAIRG
jgi:release factor glutamine methyltransferase